MNGIRENYVTEGKSRRASEDDSAHLAERDLNLPIALVHDLVQILPVTFSPNCIQQQHSPSPYLPLCIKIF